MRLQLRNPIVRPVLAVISARAAGLLAVAAWRRVGRRLRTLAADRYKRMTAGLVVRPPLRQFGAFFRLQADMARRYAMRPYGGRCLLLRTAQWEEFDVLDYRRFLTGETEVGHIPGHHLSMMAEPHLAILAGLIQGALDRLAAFREPPLSVATPREVGRAGPQGAAESDRDREGPAAST
jgi:hypothetical protein